MMQQRGFSLLELLISLMLVTTIALASLSQLCHTKLLIKQLLLRDNASQLLDKTEETLLVDKQMLPKALAPYPLRPEDRWHDWGLGLDWSEQSLPRRQGL